MIDIEVVVARCALELAELQRLQLGDTIRTETRVGGLVELRANGRPFARAELAQNENGEMFVLIAEFIADGSAGLMVPAARPAAPASAG